MSPFSFIEVTNIAHGKSAKQSTQSKVSDEWSADRAVDGIRGGSLVSCTQLMNRQWWMVDLGAIYHICRVDIWNNLKHRKNQLPYIQISLIAIQGIKSSS